MNARLGKVAVESFVPTENRLRKIAMARAWKREIGNLSDENVKKLEDANILDHRKEMNGLNKGTVAIAMKYDVPIIRNNPSKLQEAVRKNLDSPYFKEFSKANNLPPRMLEDVILTNVAPGGYYASTISPKGSSLIHLGDTDKFLVGNPEKYLKTKLDKDYAEAIFARHEADEARYGIQSHSDPKKHLEYKGTSIPATTGYTSHLSPKVLNQESAHTALAPAGAKNFVTNLRQMTNEKAVYQQGGLDYGKSGVVNKRIGVKLEHQALLQNKPQLMAVINDLARRFRK